jgi:hypothetical protein
MLKPSSKVISARRDAKAEQLLAKIARSQNAHAVALAECDANKVRGTERLGIIAFASTAMQEGSPRGAIARAVLIAGKSGVYTFAQVAKTAKVKIGEVSRANLEYVRNNVEFRKALVGFVVSYDLDAETVTVRPYRPEQKAKVAPRKALALAPPVSE